MTEPSRLTLADQRTLFQLHRACLEIAGDKRALDPQRHEARLQRLKQAQETFGAFVNGMTEKVSGVAG